MPIETFSAETLDDLLHDVFDALIRRGSTVRASRGDTMELSVAALELSNPLARLSRSEARGRVISCIGELCWYLAGDNSLGMIDYYLPAYAEEAVDGRILGGYGPRLFGPPPQDQVFHLIGLLKQKPSSRRAVLQLFSADDLRRLQGDVPCTCTLQFLVRGGVLELVVNMRSNDVVRGLSHDVFCFTMLQEMCARSLGLRPGRYYHIVGSLHFYVRDRPRLEQFLAEGFQSTRFPMPPMPDGDPWPAVKSFLGIEATIRTGKPVAPEIWARLPRYWQELANLLRMFHARRNGDVANMKRLQGEITDPAYSPFLSAPVQTLERGTVQENRPSDQLDKSTDRST